MAVFTEVPFEQAQTLMRALGLGELQELRGIQGGIENTNYFATTDEGEYVLTVFERLTAAQLPFYLYLMQHLARCGIPVPDPAPSADGSILHTICDKPAAVVQRLRGQSELAPTLLHCEAVGRMLAQMHLAGQDYARQQPNLRGLSWWNETAPLVLPHLNSAQSELLRSELAYQNHVAELAVYRALPRGAIHADLFRDNVMFEQGRLTGFFDFYFAGIDSYLFDLAVCLNDWCIHPTLGTTDLPRSAALVQAYASVRPLCAPERQLLPALLRAAALRFWISRLWDYHLPRQAALLQAHDPAHFERVLRQRLAHPLPASAVLEHEYAGAWA